MNKNLIFLLAIIYIINPNKIFGQNLTAKDCNLNGNVKTVTYDSYQADKGYVKIKKGWEETEKLDKTVEFNEVGKITKILYKDLNNKVIRTDKFDYSKQVLIKSITKYEIIKYSYNNQKKLETKKIFDRTPESISASNIDEIDNKEKLLVQFEYDLKGRLKKKIETNKKKNTNFITSYFYNDKDLILKEETVYNDGFKEWYDYQYDSNGKMINKKWYDNEEGLLENLTNHYENNNLLTSTWENYADGELEGKIIYRYEYGNEIEISEFDLLENTQIKWVYNYEYDSMKNWIRKTVHTYKNEYFLVERNIEYY
ncbi:hypothetical protein [uncultured Winogradskyella sp.]|uniref:hypothetical protein n=1 Tax=uncultured Winogradskyella sp. TaxID=395353 RepID=UPI00263665DF|nr:hypothetical protein [uncultured Winogradskyella sp.]